MESDDVNESVNSQDPSYWKWAEEANRFEIDNMSSNFKFKPAHLRAARRRSTDCRVKELFAFEIKGCWF